MAGRILPVALATIVGVSIGVATFDGEFKKQRIARLEEEYKRELAAASASASASSSNPAALPVATGTTASATPEQLQAPKAQAVASAPADNSWSNVLGLWAWKKDAQVQAAPVSNKNENAKGKP